MADQDDPFAVPGDERTVIMPSPGRRITPRPGPESGTPSAESNVSAAESAVPLAGMNPLLAAANPLLDIVTQLRSTADHPDPSGLRDHLAQNVKTFESRAKAAGIAPETVIGARYALCTLLDETAASTPWGGSGTWAKHSLLVMFHNEAWGGEKFFQLLSKLAENPQGNRDLLELMYICLALGFEGRYRVIDNGRAQLEALRERLAQILRKARHEYERDLSANWQGATPQRSGVVAIVPLWVAAAACGLLLLVVYFVLSYFLNDISDPAYAQIQAIRAKATMPRVVAPAPRPRLAAFLAKEIQEGLVAVQEDANKSVVTIRGDGLFEPGSATISDDYLPLLQRIGEALNALPGQVQVIGHTDNRPIHSIRFQSNWHLSLERARSVSQLLARYLPAVRISADGRAETEPIASNDTPEGRARNRRVEITLFVSHTGT